MEDVQAEVGEVGKGVTQARHKRRVVQRQVHDEGCRDNGGMETLVARVEEQPAHVAARYCPRRSRHDRLPPRCYDGVEHSGCITRRPGSSVRKAELYRCRQAWARVETPTKVRVDTIAARRRERGESPSLSWSSLRLAAIAASVSARAPNGGAARCQAHASAAGCS